MHKPKSPIKQYEPPVITPPGTGPVECATKPPATLAEALVIIEAQRQQLEAWRKIDAKDEEIIHKADEGRNGN